MIYFVQHGAALSKEFDKERPLSNIGVDETRQVANKLKAQNIAIDKIFHSGKLRSLQTANLFSEILNIGTVTELSGMNPNDEPSTLIEQLSEDNSMYIGHLPNIQKVVSKLVTNDENNTAVEFQNSALACVEINGDDASIKWFITPND